MKKMFLLVLFLVLSFNVHADINDFYARVNIGDDEVELKVNNECITHEIGDCVMFVKYDFDPSGIIIEHSFIACKEDYSKEEKKNTKIKDKRTRYIGKKKVSEVKSDVCQ